MQAILSHPRTPPEPSVVEGRGGSRAWRRLPNFARREDDASNDGGAAFSPRIFLVPLTLSHGSRAALAVARSLACGPQAKIVLLHVVRANTRDEEVGPHRPPLNDELHLEAEFHLRELANGVNDEETLVCAGCPAKVIVETARRLEADTIVMCTHGYRGWLKWLHHNTALKVMRQAPCRIWLVSPGRGDATVNLRFVNRTNNLPAARACGHS